MQPLEQFKELKKYIDDGDLEKTEKYIVEMARGSDKQKLYQEINWWFRKKFEDDAPSIFDLDQGGKTLISAAVSIYVKCAEFGGDQRLDRLVKLCMNLVGDLSEKLRIDKFISRLLRNRLREKLEAPREEDDYIIRYLIDKKETNIRYRDEDEKKPLLYSALEGCNTEYVTLLVQKGFDPNEIFIDEETDIKGTPLMHCARNNRHVNDEGDGHCKAVNALLDLKANVNVAVNNEIYKELYKGQMAIHIAALYPGATSIPIAAVEPARFIKLLLDYGAQADAVMMFTGEDKKEEGLTPLTIVVKENTANNPKYSRDVFLILASSLINHKYGSNIFFRPPKGKSAYEMALDAKYPYFSRGDVASDLLYAAIKAEFNKGHYDEVIRLIEMREGRLRQVMNNLRATRSNYIEDVCKAIDQCDKDLIDMFKKGGHGELIGYFIPLGTTEDRGYFVPEKDRDDFEALINSLRQNLRTQLADELQKREWAKVQVEEKKQKEEKEDENQPGGKSSNESKIAEIKEEDSQPGLKKIVPRKLKKRGCCRAIGDFLKWLFWGIIWLITLPFCCCCKGEPKDKIDTTIAADQPKTNDVASISRSSTDLDVKGGLNVCVTTINTSDASLKRKGSGADAFKESKEEKEDKYSSLTYRLPTIAAHTNNGRTVGSTSSISSSSSPSERSPLLTTQPPQNLGIQ